MATKVYATVTGTNTALDGDKTIFKDASGANTYLFELGAKAQVVSSTGGDTFALLGTASEYTIRAVGKTLTLKDSDGNVIKINVQSTNSAAVSNTIQFADGAAALEFNGKTFSIGGANVGRKATDMSSKMTLDATVSSVDTYAAAVEDAGAPANLGQTFTLTNGIDAGVAFTGTEYNDTFNAFYDATNKSATLTALDSINGGNGVDTLNVIETAAVALPATATVTNIETANITSSATVDGSTANWTGLESLNVTQYGGQTAGLTAAATTAVTVTEKALAAGNVVVDGGSTVTVTSTATTTGGTIKVGGTTAAAGAVSVTSNISGTGHTAAAITVTGGTTVNVAQNITSSTLNANETAGAVIVNGNASTTSVTATATKAVTKSATVAGVVNNSVKVVDANYGTTTAGTIASVTANGYTTLEVDSSVLSTLSVANGSSDITIKNEDAIATATTTLGLTVNGLTGGTLDDADVYTAMNIATTGAASTLTDITSVNVKSIAISGDQVLTITNASASLDSLASVTVAGSAGLSADLSNEAALTSFVSTSSGNNTLTVANTATTVTGGTGADTVTFTGAIGATAVVNLGGGNDSLTIAGKSTKGASITGGEGVDTLVVADGGYIDGVVAYTSFETVSLNGIATSTLDMSLLSSVTSIAANKALTGAATITKVAAGTTLDISTADANLATTGAIDLALATDTATDALDVTLTTTDSATKAAAGAGDDSLNTITVTSLVGNNYETITVNSTVTNVDGSLAASPSDNTAAGYINTISSLEGSDLTTLTLKGNTSIKVTDMTAAALTKVDATAMTGSLEIALDASANSAAVAVLGGSAADTITMTNNAAANNIIVGNGGADIITLAAAGTKETVRIASDTDSVLTLTDTTTPAVTPVVMDTATGYDSIATFTSGEDKIELSALLGLATGDARTAITGKGTIGDNTVTNAELAAALQTLIGTGTDFFNDGAVDRAVAQVIIDDATDATMIFIDTNADGNFTNGTDQAIYLTGLTTGITINDLVFG